MPLTDEQNRLLLQAAQDSRIAVEILRGDATDPDRPGLIMRVDRIEQIGKKQAAFTAMAVAAAITAVVTWLWALLTTGHKP